MSEQQDSSKNRVKCCCVVLNYNDWSRTTLFVQRMQSYSSIQTILIVDNCSTDNSFEHLQQACADNVILVQSNHNGGYGAGNNFGVKYARDVLGFEYVLIANPDVIVENTVINSMLLFLEQDVVRACIAPQQMNESGILNPYYCWKIPTIMGSIFQYGIFDRLLKFNHYKAFKTEKTIVAVDCVPGALILVRADSFLRVGGYDERIFLYCEETVIGFKFKEYGYKTCVMLDGTYIHEHVEIPVSNIKKIIDQKKTLFKSRGIFLSEYLHVNHVQRAIFKIVCATSILKSITKFLFSKLSFRSLRREDL